VRHRGEHYTVDGMRFLPRPIQRPGVPVWDAVTVEQVRGVIRDGPAG
jgi:alkanesulfonate monooxygenase SsuD/methylene tetrahydromethanopterin reductase-like flavin-dependent oxidoreductase (luciferase family)